MHFFLELIKVDMGAKGWRSKCGFSVYFCGVMEHSRKDRGHVLGLLCNAEEAKSCLI